MRSPKVCSWGSPERPFRPFLAKSTFALVGAVTALLVAAACGSGAGPSPLSASSAPSGASEAKAVALRLTAIRVVDGDTVTGVLDGADVEERIRLQGIDAPEIEQAGGQDASTVLAAFLTTGDVTVVGSERDKYGRLLGELFVHERSVNWSLVRAGHAWWYEQYSDDEGLKAAQAQAQIDGDGLWAAPSPVAPWEYRIGKRVAPPAGAVDAVFSTAQDLDPGAVFVTRTGKRFHRGDCRFVQESKIPIGRADAEAKFGACRVCKP